MKLRLTIEAGPGVRTSFEHGGPVIQIGRDPECELSLQGEASTAVSRRHARIDLTAAGATLADTGSSNGTLLNGQPLNALAPLRVGDRIQMGYTGATLTVVEIDVAAPPAPPTIPAAPPNRAVLIGSLAAVAVAAVVAITVLLLREPKATQQVAEVRPTQRSVEGPPSTTPTNTEKNQGEQNRKEPPPPPLVPKELPRDDEKKVGSFVAGDKNWISVLVQRKAEANPWAVLQQGDWVYTANTLISLPGYRSLLALDSGVNLTLWGNLPEFASPPPERTAPVLESAIMLNAPDPGFDLDFTLDRGRVHVANRKDPKGPAKVRFRFLRQTWDLELADDNSEVVLELWSLPVEVPDKGPRQTPYLCLGLFASGKVTIQTPNHCYEEQGSCTFLAWATATKEEYRRSLPEKPAWWSKAPNKETEEVKSALRSLLDWRDVLGGPKEGKPPEKESKSLAETIVNQLKNVRDPDNQDKGLLMLAALDELDALLGFLDDGQNLNVRNVALFALRGWMSRGNQNVDRLTEVLKQRYNKSEAQAKHVVRLLSVLPDQGYYAKKENCAFLVRSLNDDNQQVRDLAFWHLFQMKVFGLLPPEANALEYDPTWERAKRQSVVERLNGLIEQGKLPATPGR
jgi:pSer/pThr/pTyr-binding forkhead associated (FHA) protein